MKRNDILVCIPTYNERDNIRPLYRAIKDLSIPLDILFCDDNSPDGTGAIIDQIIDKDPTVFALHRQQKMGLGTAFLQSFEYAKKHQYKYLIGMDADFTHDPKYIPQLIKRSAQFDIVIGSRYASGGKMIGWSSIRQPFTLFWRNRIKKGLGMPYDCTGSFRLYTVDILKPETINRIQSKGFAFCMESLFWFIQAGAVVGEVPIVAHTRIHGKSKLSVAIMWEVFKTYCRLRWHACKAKYHMLIEKKPKNGFKKI